jgi:hypothetical protein
MCRYLLGETPPYRLTKREKIVSEHIYYWNSICRYKFATSANQIENISITAVNIQTSILTGANFMKQRNS